jgi:hypothetical protein
MYKIQAMTKKGVNDVENCKEMLRYTNCASILKIFVKFNIPRLEIKYSNYVLCVIFNFNLSEDQLKFEPTPHLKP